eukprot:1822315-Pyramimonas_sp.AAC.1
MLVPSPRASWPPVGARRCRPEQPRSPRMSSPVAAPSAAAAHRRQASALAAAALHSARATC